MTGSTPAATDELSAAAGVLTSVGPIGVWAWVALNVEPVPGSASGGGSDAQRRAEAALADAGWLAGQWNPAAGTKLELRYLHRPGEGVRCALLGRVYAATVDAASSAAIELRERLGVLPAHVRAANVESAAEVQRLLNPFPAHPSGLVEVRKQFRVGQPSRPDAGVAYYLAVPRFAAGAASWEPLWQMVADLPQPFMLTVGLEPYAPQPQFIGMLGDIAARYGRLGTPGRTAVSPLRQQSFALAADPFAAYAARLFDDARRHYQSAVFRTRITIASSAPLPPALVAQVSATICAPRGDGDITHVAVGPAPDEMDAAWHNVITLDHHRWDRYYLGHLPVPVPSGLRLLAETVDAAEAVSGWRLPPAPARDGRHVFVSVTAQNLHVARLDTAHVNGDSFNNIGAGAVIVNRSTLAADRPEAAVAPDRLRILLACANPRESRPLRTAEEDRTLRESIQLSPNRDRIEIETLNAVTIDDLRRALLRSSFDVVHFSGHGTRRGLIFENAGGQLFVPSSEALAELLARRQIRIAVLNACYSLSVGRISAIGTEYTIAASGPIADPAAIEFTRGFYDALGAGLPVPDAFEEGKGTASLKGLSFDGILLRRGEEYVAPSTTIPSAGLRTASRTTLVGVAWDVSGGSGANHVDGVVESLADLGYRIGDDTARRDIDLQDPFRLFAYAYGLRINDGVADLASVWKAVEAATVDSVDLVAAETGRLGSTTLLPSDLARLFGRASSRQVGSWILTHLGSGTAPLVRAGHAIRERFASMGGESNEDRMLVVISGSEPSDGDPRPIFRELRNSGIDIVSVLMTDDGADQRALVASPGESWPTAARLMWEVASRIDASSPMTRCLLDHGWSIEPGAKLCVQIGHAGLLKEFIRALTSRPFSDERLSLPAGR